MSIPFSTKVNERAVPLAITNEPHIIGIIATATYSPGNVRLTEVPQGPTPNVFIPGYIEIPSGAPVGTQFVVDYTTGVLTFNTAQDGNSIQVSYTGLGSEIAAEDVNEIQNPLSTIATQSITYNWPSAPTVTWSLAANIVKPANISNTATDDFLFPRNVTVTNLLTTNGVSSSAALTLRNQSPVIFNDTTFVPKTVTVEAPTTVTTSYTLKWPVLQGSALSFLQNDGTGNLSFVGASGNFVSSITGTPNQVIASASTGPVTLSLPQSIATTSGVQFGTIGLGGPLVPSAILSLLTTVQGFLPPVMTTTQRNAIVSPATGLEIYNSTNNTPEVFNGSVWTAMGGGGGSPGGSDTQIQYNSSGSFAGASGLTTDGINLTATGTIFTDSIQGDASPLNITTLGGTLNTSDININPGDVTSGIFTAGDLNLRGGNGTAGGFGASLTLAGWLAFPGGPSDAILSSGTSGDVIINAAVGNTPFEIARFTSNNNVGIGIPSPDPSALLDLTSTTKGFLLPRLTTTQRDATVVFASGSATVVNYTGLSGAVFTVNGFALTEGVQWTAAINNDATATSLASAITTATASTLSTAIASTNIVTITANNPGVQGNNVTLNSSDPIDLSFSGTTLSGGAPATSLEIFNTTTNQPEFWDGSVWVNFVSTPAGSTGAVQFNSSGAFGADTANFFWDDTFNRLGIGTNTPGFTLHLGSISASLVLGNTSTTYARMDGGSIGVGAAPASLPGLYAQETTGFTRWFMGFADTSGDFGIYYNNTPNFALMSTPGINPCTAIGNPATTPAASAVLDVQSTTKGFLPPRMTTTQRNAISSPASGLMVYDTTANQWYGYNGTSWVILG